MTLNECPGCGSRGEVHRDWCSQCTDATPTDGSERSRLGWWCIQGEALLAALKRCSEGQPPYVVYAEMYANSEHEYPEGHG